MVSHVCRDVWINDAGVYFKTIRPLAQVGGVCGQCSLWASDNCISGNSLSCEAQIGGRVFKKITKEEAEKLMGKKKFIVKFVNHDENELVEAMCSAHAAILAQSRRIEMGENDVTVKSVEPIIPYVVTVGTYTVTVNDDELTVKSHGEHVNMSADCGFVIMRLAKRIEELEKAQNNKNRLLENLLNEMKQDIKKDLRDIDILAKLREMLGISKGKQR